jgi:hypothetical protein
MSEGVVDAGGPLAALRRGSRADLAVLAAFAVGLAASFVHPAGLVGGGAVLGVVASGVRRAWVLGLELGLLVAVIDLVVGVFARSPIVGVVREAAPAVSPAVAAPLALVVVLVVPGVATVPVRALTGVLG